MITLEAAKAHCRIEHDHEDALVESLIAAAIRHVEHRTGQIFGRRDGEELILDSLPNGGIELGWTPVRAVVELAYRDSEGIEQLLPGSSLYLDQRGVYPVLYPAAGESWPDHSIGRGAVKVRADVGYAEAPADVRAAALLIVGHLYENREAVVIGTISSELPMGVELLLAPYVIHRVA